MNKAKRLFFAVSVPDEVKKRVGEELLQEIPNHKWRKVKPENVHITVRFLGYLPWHAVEEIREKARALEDFESFEAELRGIGHFRNRVLWLGVGKGSGELKLLSAKTCSLLGLKVERFHAHLTLARNKGSKVSETSALIEALRGKGFRESLVVEGIDLMESILHRSGPEYKRVFSIAFRPR